MSADPWQIFKGDEGRQNTLKILWPELYECLAELDNAGPPRVIRCVLSGRHPDVPTFSREGRPLAVARLDDAYGPPACRGCIDAVHGKGHPGWPLKRERKART
jgi:hypothetical protein